MKKKIKKCKLCNQIIESIIEKDICLSCEVINGTFGGIKANILLSTQLNNKSKKYWINKIDKILIK